MMDKGRLSFDKSVLLLIDYQYAYSAESKFKTINWDKVVIKTKKLLNICRKKNIPVVHTRMRREADGVGSHPNDPRDENGLPFYTVAGTKEIEIIEELKPLEGEKVIDKHRFSAFFQTNLDLILRGLGANHLIMSGISTDQCFLTTVSGAYHRCYDITIVKDACAASSEAIHKTSILDLSNWIYGCSIFAAEELIKAINGEQYHGWFWKKPGEHLYSIETIEEMYEQI